MKTVLRWAALSLAVASFTVAVGCSSDDDDNPSDSGGTTTREFVSGNLAGGESFTHVFRTAKVVPYFCRYHGGAGGVGMSGVITVSAGGTPSSHDVSIVDNTLPTMTIDIMDTITWTNNHGIPHTVESDS